MAEAPYFIEVDHGGCGHCGAGKTWCVVGPDGVAGGTSYEDEQDAADMADAMNEAYWAGRGSLRRIIERALSALPDSDTAGPDGDGYRYAWDELGGDEQAWVKTVRAELGAAIDGPIRSPRGCDCEQSSNPDRAWHASDCAAVTGACHHCDEPMPNGRCWWCGGPNTTTTESGQ